MHLEQSARKIWRQFVRRRRVAEKAYRVQTSRFRGTPDFIIIGAQKGGTSSLYSYLASHPFVIGAFRKELHFFDYNFARGFDWYRAHFPTEAYKSLLGRHRGGRILTGEASPYYIFHPHVAARINEALPDVKLIVMLRHPVDRAYSHYQHQSRRGLEMRQFDVALHDESGTLSRELIKLMEDPDYVGKDYASYSYLTRGVYADQLERWFDLFGRDQFLIINSEDFFSAPQEQYDSVLRFLELPQHQLKDIRVVNAGHYGGRMDADLRRRLVDYFRPHNERLFRLIGQTYDHWSD
jgi:hypothetical protein